MSTSQVLDRTFQLYRRHFALLVGIGVLLPALLLAVQLAFVPLGWPPRGNEAANPFALFPVLFGFLGCYFVVYFIGQALTGGATVYGVAKLHLGEEVTIGGAYKQVLSRFWRILGIVILVFLMLMVVIIGGEIIAIVVVAVFAGSLKILSGAGGAATGAAIAGVIVAICLFGAAIFVAFLFYVRFSLAVPACMLERLPVGSALSRSWSLTKGSAGRLMLVYLLAWVLGFALGFVFAVPGQVYALAMHGKSFLAGVLLQEIGGFIAGALANPIAAIAVALIYYDQRVRKEAFDLQWMMQSIPSPDLPQPPPPQAPPPAPAATIPQ